MGEVNVQDFPSVIRDFMAYKSAIQGCSSRTVDEYMLDLRTFFRFLIASREGLPTLGEEFEKIDIRNIDIDFIKNISVARNNGDVEFIHLFFRPIFINN